MSIAPGAVRMVLSANEITTAEISDPTQCADTPQGLEPTNDEPTSNAKPIFNKGFQFWAILFAISIAALLCSLEATITSTALPSIIAALGGDDKYVWAVNIYYLFM